MHRATPLNSSFRGYVSGGSRGTVDQADDNTLMQEHSGNQMHSETRGAIESPQNYGFTSVVMPADKGPDGKMTASAENQISYSGGNRSFPVAGPMDDRRHRLRGLSAGDSAMHRGKDDDMQIQLSSDGMYHSAPQQVRMQLVPQGSGKANPPQKKSQGSATKQSLYATRGPRIEARLWAGLEPELQEQLDIEVDRIERAANGGRPTVGALASGGNGGGGSSGDQNQGQSQKTGQKSVAGAGKDSKDFFHVKKDEVRASSAKRVRMAESKDDDDVLHETFNKNDYCGGTKAKHKFALIVTTKGPAKNAWGRLP